MLVYLLSLFYMHGCHCVHSFLYLELFIKHYILVKRVTIQSSRLCSPCFFTVNIINYCSCEWPIMNTYLCVFGFFRTSNYFLRVGFTSVHIFLRGGFYFNGSWQIFQIAFQRHSTNFRVSSAVNGLLVCLGFCQQKNVNVMREKKPKTYFFLLIQQAKVLFL